MARNVDLWSHLPPFLKDFREMRALIDTENPEFNLAVKRTDAIVDEMFIKTATDTGLSRYESMLGLSPAPGDSLQARRSAILARWNDVTPYTMTALKNRLAAIQGNNGFQVRLPEDRPYEIEIVTHLEKPGQADELAYLIKTMIPCNLAIHSRNIIAGEASLSIGYGVGASLTGTLFLTNDLRIEQNLSIEAGVFAGMSAVNALFLTNDLTEPIHMDVAAGVAAVGSITPIIEING